MASEIIAASIPGRRAKTLTRIFTKANAAAERRDAGKRNQSYIPSASGELTSAILSPFYLISNATSHKWIFGALADLLDNAVDEHVHGATYVKIDTTEDPRDMDEPMLYMEDDGPGISVQKVQQCLSFGYSMGKTSGSIGKHGNGLKSSTMRLGQSMLLLTRHAESNTCTAAMLSFEFHIRDNQDSLFIPQVQFHADTWEDIRGDGSASNRGFEKNLQALMNWSPYSSKKALVEQLKSLPKRGGTRVLVWNLWHQEHSKDTELDFHQDTNDIQLRGYDREKHRNDPFAKKMLEYEYSFRKYVEILYKNLPNNFTIILRGVPVRSIDITKQYMKEVTKQTYIPRVEQNDNQNDKVAKDLDQLDHKLPIEIGFAEDARMGCGTSMNGFWVYHNNRLIKHHWQVFNCNWSTGRGVIGQVDANFFLVPTHDKQDFDQNARLRKLEEKLKTMVRKYWNDNSWKIGYGRDKIAKKKLDKKRKDSKRRDKQAQQQDEWNDLNSNDDTEDDTDMFQTQQANAQEEEQMRWLANFEDHGGGGAGSSSQRRIPKRPRTTGGGADLEGQLTFVQSASLDPGRKMKKHTDTRGGRETSPTGVPVEEDKLREQREARELCEWEGGAGDVGPPDGGVRALLARERARLEREKEAEVAAVREQCEHQFEMAQELHDNVVAQMEMKEDAATSRVIALEQDLEQALQSVQELMAQVKKLKGDKARLIKEHAENILEYQQCMREVAEETTAEAQGEEGQGSEQGGGGSSRLVLPPRSPSPHQQHHPLAAGTATGPLGPDPQLDIKPDIKPDLKKLKRMSEPGPTMVDLTEDD